jgi:general secretion pathway protein K
VLWVIVLAGIILLSLNRSAMVQAYLANNELATVQARWLARAGVEQALAVLANDIDETDSPLDYWYDDSFSFEQYELDSGTFSVISPDEQFEGVGAIRYGLTDLSGKLNISSASEDALMLLPDIHEEQVQSIIDWRDGDKNTRPGGAEQGYYQNLDFPYEVANAPFTSIYELRLVRGIDDETFYGEDANLNGVLDANENDGDDSAPTDIADGRLELGLAGLTTVHSYENNTDPYGATRVNLNSVDYNTLKDTFNLSARLAVGVIEKRDDDEFESVLELAQVRAGSKGAGPEEGEVDQFDLEWVAEHYDLFTIDDEERYPGRINLNTAPVEVLETLPDITPEQARQIFDYRLSPQGPILGYHELLNSGFVDEDTLRAIIPFVSLRSHVFEVRSVGVAGNGVRRQLTAVVDRGQNPARIIYQYHQE